MKDLAVQRDIQGRLCVVDNRSYAGAEVVLVFDDTEQVQELIKDLSEELQEED